MLKGNRNAFEILLYKNAKMYATQRLKYIKFQCVFREQFYM